MTSLQQMLISYHIESTPSHIPAFSPRLDSPSRSDTDSDAAPSPPRASSLRTPTPGSETEPIHGPGAEEDFPMDNDEDSDRNAGDLLAMNSDPAVSPPPRSSTTPSPSLGLARAPRRYHSRYSNVKRGLFTTPSLMWNDPDGRIRREDEEEGDEDEEEGAGRHGPFLSTSEAGGSRTPTPQMEGVVYSAAEDNFAGFEVCPSLHYPELSKTFIAGISRWVPVQRRTYEYRGGGLDAEINARPRPINCRQA